MSSKFWAELSSDYEKLFEAEIGYDVIIYAGEEPNVKEIHAHSNIFCIRSNVSGFAFFVNHIEFKEETVTTAKVSKKSSKNYWRPIRKLEVNKIKIYFTS